MVDDRYRIAQTTENISASFWEVAQEYGLTIPADEQVAVCRMLAATLKARSGPLSRKDVLAAFERIGIRSPSGRGSFPRDLIARLERVVG